MDLGKCVRLLCAPLVVLAAPARGAADGDGLPPWGSDELIAVIKTDLGFEPGEITAIHLLAWNRERDRRGSEIDNVLFWFRAHVSDPKSWDKKSPDLWVLFTMSRSSGGDGRWWENPRVGSHGAPGIAIFERPPRNQDIYDFLGDNWEFASNARYSLIEGKVGVKTWREVIGENPTKFHTGER